MRYLNGNCSNPTTVGYKSAFKKLLCYRISDLKYRNANCEPEESEESHELVILDQPDAEDKNILLPEGTIDLTTIQPTDDGKNDCEETFVEKQNTKNTLSAPKIKCKILNYSNDSFNFPKRPNKIVFNRRHLRKRPYDTTKRKVNMSFKRKEYDVEKIMMNNCATTII